MFKVTLRLNVIIKRRGDKMRILIIEDEKQLSEAIAQLLSQHNYGVDVTYDGESGLDYALTGLYDAILLDIMLPKMDGLTVLEKLRRAKINTPVLLLTAKSEVQDKICGLDCGADDYLTKPFDTGELLARIRAMTRRKGEILSHQLSFSNIVLDRESMLLKNRSQTIKLGIKEFQILEMLLMSPTTVIAKERFIEKIWGYDSEAEYNTIEVYISFLRKKLSALHAKCAIQVTRGVGYSLEACDD